MIKNILSITGGVVLVLLVAGLGLCYWGAIEMDHACSGQSYIDCIFHR